MNAVTIMSSYQMPDIADEHLADLYSLCNRDTQGGKGGCLLVLLSADESRLPDGDVPLCWC